VHRGPLAALACSAFSGQGRRQQRIGFAPTDALPMERNTNFEMALDHSPAASRRGQ